MYFLYHNFPKTNKKYQILSKGGILYLFICLLVKPVIAIIIYKLEGHLYYIK